MSQLIQGNLVVIKTLVDLCSLLMDHLILCVRQILSCPFVKLQFKVCSFLLLFSFECLLFVVSCDGLVEDLFEFGNFPGLAILYENLHDDIFEFLTQMTGSHSLCIFEILSIRQLDLILDMNKVKDAVVKRCLDQLVLQRTKL